MAKRHCRWVAAVAVAVAAVVVAAADFEVDVVAAVVEIFEGS